MMEHVRAQTGTSSSKIKFQAQTRPPEESINTRQDHPNTKKGHTVKKTLDTYPNWFGFPLTNHLGSDVYP